MNKKLHYGTFCSVKRLNETFCSVKPKYATFRPPHTCEEYVTYIPKIEENTIKIGHFSHKCRYSTFIITEDGYRHRVWKDSVKVIISLNLSASNIKIL